MDKVLWNDQLNTGFDRVDDQHRRLMDVLNRLIGMSEPGRAGGLPDVALAVRDLGGYVRQHFDDEIRMMQDTRCDLRHVMMHAREHEHFVRHLSMFEESMNEPGGTSAEKAAELGRFLAKWLWRHILVVDQVMARQVRRIQAGEDPARVYDDEVASAPEVVRPNESYA
jgi:two-component system NtrC family sensor kinase